MRYAVVGDRAAVKARVYQRSIEKLRLPKERNIKMPQKRKVVVKRKSKRVPMVALPAKKAAEVTRLGGALRALGGLGGKMLGGLIGQSEAGGSLGTGLGASISRWLGSGDYTVSSNSLVSRVQASGEVPSMHKEGQTIIVRHKEFITEVIGNTSFNVQQQYPINPGLSTTFPWLAGIASQYSEYRIRGMVYHYVPTSGNTASGTNPALGSVMLQTSYRANEVAPASKVEMLNEYWASEGKPSEAFCHPIECDPKENPFNVQYVRGTAVPTGDSPLLYDLGKTTLAVSGQQATGNVLGDLWVTYEIELRKPVMTTINNANIVGLVGTATANINGTNNPYGTDFTITNSTFIVTPVVAGAFGAPTISFPPGTTGAYAVQCYYLSSTAASFPAWSISGVGSSLVNSLAATNGRSSTYTVGTGTAINTVFINITNPSTTTVLTGGLTSMVGCTRMYLYITEINPNVLA